MIAFLRKTRLWRGNDRGYLRLLQRAIRLMSAREQRMAVKEAEFGEAGFFFDNAPDHSITAAMQLLSDRIDAALVEKA